MQSYMDDLSGTDLGASVRVTDSVSLSLSLSMQDWQVSVCALGVVGL